MTRLAAATQEPGVLGSLRTETAVARSSGAAYALSAEAIKDLERQYPEVTVPPSTFL